MLEGVVPYDYDDLCQKCAVGEAARTGWRALRVALGGRSGWWFLDPRTLTGFDGGPMWCFGPKDGAQMCITPAGSTFQIYRADTDDEVVLDAIGDVVAWLDVHEPDEVLSPMLMQMLDGGGPGDRRRH